MPAATTETTVRTGPTCTLREAVEAIGANRISYSKLRRIAVDEKEFTVVRDAVGHGNPILLRWDEIDVYIEGRLPALRKFRIKKGRP